MRGGALTGAAPATAALAILLASCGPADTDSGSGPTVPEWRIDPEPLASIGRLEGPTAELLSRVTGAALLPDGGVAIADAGSATLRLFEPDGRVRRIVGRPGEGPGEFGYISGLDLVPPDRLKVYDADNQRLSTYSLDGELRSSVTFRAATGFPELYLGTLSDGSHALAWIEQTGRDPERVTPDVMAIGRFEADGGSGSTVASVEGMRRMGTGPLPFSPHFLAARVRDTLFVTDGRRPALTVVGPQGERVRSLSLPLAATPVVEARAALAPLLTPERRAALGELSRLEADSVPMLADLFADDEGRLWVKPYEPATDSHWIGRARTGGPWFALSTGGEVVARIEVPGDLRLLDARGGRAVGLVRDELGVERVRIHALRLGGPSSPRSGGSR